MTIIRSTWGAVVWWSSRQNLLFSDLDTRPNNKSAQLDRLTLCWLDNHSLFPPSLSNSWVSSVPVTSTTTTTTDASIAASLSSRRQHEILVNRSQPFCSFLHVSSHNMFQVKSYESKVTSSVSRPDFSAWPDKIQKRKRVKSKRQVRQTKREEEEKDKRKMRKKANERKRERKKDRGQKKRWVWTKRNGFRETSKSVSTLFFLFFLLWIYIQRLPFTFSPSFLFSLSLFSTFSYFFFLPLSSFFRSQETLGSRIKIRREEPLTQSPNTRWYHHFWAAKVIFYSTNQFTSTDFSPTSHYVLTLLPSPSFFYWSFSFLSFFTFSHLNSHLSPKVLSPRYFTIFSHICLRRVNKEDDKVMEEKESQEERNRGRERERQTGKKRGKGKVEKVGR